jgi:hypothetical protein
MESHPLDLHMKTEKQAGDSPNIRDRFPACFCCHASREKVWETFSSGSLAVDTVYNFIV